MPYIEKITIEKASLINSDPGIYGTFAEIGAGQEVVNHFFKAGFASQTVAKSMSAYDMTFSDHIYGRSGRYVSENRLKKMLDHEYGLLEKRLKKKRGRSTRFFAFADTVAAATAGRRPEASAHGWMGIRFQHKAQASFSEIICHVNLLDKTRLQQYEALGILGVNLIYSAFHSKKEAKSLIKSLVDNFESARVSINFLKAKGKIFKNLKEQELNLELIRQKLTQALLFQKDSKNILPSEALYEKAVLITPYDAKNLYTRLKNTLSYIKKDPVLAVYIPIQKLKTKNLSDLFKTLSPLRRLAKHYYILAGNFKKLYSVRQFIREKAGPGGDIFICLNKNDLPKKDSLEFFSRLYDKNTQVIADHKVFRSLDNHLRKYLKEKGRLADLKE